MLTTAILLLGAASAQTPITCCDHAGVQEVVVGVAAVARAVADDKPNAVDTMLALRDLEVDPKLPKEERDTIAGMQKAAQLQSVYDDGAERALAYLTRHALFLALRHEGGDLTIAEGWCAESEKGWIQTETTKLRRPWKGCGTWR